MQDSLFPELAEADLPAAARPAAKPTARARKPAAGVVAASVPDELPALAARLPAHVRIGSSSWSYPGWAGFVWDGAYDASVLAKRGLEAYARHPLLRTVSIDRNFYQPLAVADYARYAAQVPPHFRFVAKAPSLVTDATVRGEDGRGTASNPHFLDPELAVQGFVQPALEGLGEHCGALVFQLSPLPARWLVDLPRLHARLDAMLGALPSLRPQAPDGIIAVEVRDAALLTPEFAALLRRHGATYCLGVHAKLPPLEAQLPLLRALWPGPLVCRWNYHRRHGAYGYEEAERVYAPFDRLRDADPDTRAALARVMAGTAAAGQKVYVTISNKAEGSAPLSAFALAQAFDEAMAARAAGR
ncbi:DUF72 domain-containing protein [Ramlibacter tataouinensis]|uniref:DUF72 domain-containing protein n=1 Tax=Ramlibacter tataouinensis (strain ATCC BAA-407 / DSM 14655 / LMG 21543 / TTB310) TaxID=365046 RepID=F5XXT1_RAMTT|nr:DUF72 domain-containing protein [Ramlibacter tataouinensis]AEG93066.1 conserved hypothetical protein [Ramlibacter tataouinensis TTB310]